VFVGHFALGYAAKKATPRTSLATLFVAAQLADILWPILLALGIEEVWIVPTSHSVVPLRFVSYPYSHSLLMLIVWGALFAGGYYARTKNSRAASIIFALVVSHWVLDWISHLPDMPLWPGGPKYGLGMWNSPMLTLVVELAMFLAGVWIYARGTRARDKQGTWGFWILFLVLLAAYFGNAFGGAPPSVQVIWITAMIGTAITLGLAIWSDRHRSAVTF
jgi:hypothetical protein